MTSKLKFLGSKFLDMIEFDGTKFKIGGYWFVIQKDVQVDPDDNNSEGETKN